MATQTLVRKLSPLHERREKTAGVLDRIRVWRAGVGVKLHGWNEVKTIRQWRDRK